MTAELSTVGVVGLGSVGQALAELLDAAGLRVVGVDPDLDALRHARRRTPDRVVLTSRLEELAQAQVVVEAVPESKDVKAAVLRAISDACPDDETTLVTTTATLSLASLAVASGRPARLVGLTTLMPPTAGAGVELVPTAMTDPDAEHRVEALLARLPLERERFAGAARLRAVEMVLGLLNQAVRLHESGYAGRDDIDTAMRLGCGLPIGPLALLDHVGLDAAHRALTDLHARTGLAAHAPADLLARMVAAGRSGRKCGRGFYRYPASPAAAATSAVADRPADPPPRPVGRIGIVGSGTMAGGIAYVTAAAGFDTVVVARAQDRAENTVAGVDQAMVRAVRRGQLTPDTRRTALARLRASADRADLGDCDLVVEATAEEPTTKLEIFAELDKRCREGAILATTTSSLSVTACAAATTRPADVVGLHFFNPAPVMKLVEVVHTAETSAQVLATVHALVRTLGKTAVGCTDQAGFVVNRLLFPYLNDAIRTVAAGGVAIEEVDAAVQRGFGFPMGPFALLDIIGLDVSEAILQRLNDSFGDPHVDPAPLLLGLVELGRLGRKTAAGFYHHKPRPPL